MLNRSNYSRTMVGRLGAVSTGHPLATSAATHVLDSGGNAVDATIAAQLVIATIMPQAAGLAGDLLALIRTSPQSVIAINGVGRSPRSAPVQLSSDGGSSVTVPGFVDACFSAHDLYGSRPIAQLFQPAIRLARHGYTVDSALHRAVNTQRERISKFGSDGWPLLRTMQGEPWLQPELSNLLEELSTDGQASFYKGATAEAIISRLSKFGGTLSLSDLSAHSTQISKPVRTRWGDGYLYAQPPSSQGILLSMAIQWLDQFGSKILSEADLQHVLVELTEAVFGSRDDVALGDELLKRQLNVDLKYAQNLGGPRAYLHTAGTAIADSEGMVVSSLASVFDDFGSGVYVPELGIVLNNRAGGFTQGSNAFEPQKFPVHTLAPILLDYGAEQTIALATPGADGQVQTLLQILSRVRFLSSALDEAISKPRWRSEGGNLLVEESHPSIGNLRERGHRTINKADGDDLFGAVTMAGLLNNDPVASSDWRRNLSTGVA